MIVEHGTGSAVVSPTAGSVRRVAYDLFVDLTTAGFDCTSVDGYVDRLETGGGIAGETCSLTVALPADIGPLSAQLSLRADPDPGRAPIVLLARAMRRAAAERRHLVVLLGPLLPEQDTLFELIEGFERDPMFGTAQPRFREDGTDQIWPLPGLPDWELADLRTSCAALRFVPETTITPELIAACVVLRWNLLTLALPLDETYGGSAGALLELLCQARRYGMRSVIMNRVVVASRLRYPELYPVPDCAGRDRLRLRYPERDLAERQITGLAERRLEPLLAATHCEATERRILVDCRDMPARHNGSTQCMLGFLDGFAALECAGQIDVLVSLEAARFHSLAQRCAGFRSLQHTLSGQYFAAVTLSQPWTMSAVATLHRHALVLAFSMLDTIAWDVLYPTGAEGLGIVWRFIARHADGLLYNSQFTRERFNMRFPIRPGLAERVTHHSLMPEEHIHPAAQAEPVSDYVLVFGNEYDHKSLRPTLQLLVDAFPFNRIVAFGVAEASGRNVRAIPSGDLKDADLHRLIAGARVLVFPSFYEGFGLPVVEGLAYGRPVVVRRSPLWTEIAGWSRLPGTLIEFDDTPSLVESVGRVLAGLPTQGLPSGARLAGEATPVGWRDCAARVIALLDNCLVTADGSRWRERDEALHFAGLSPQ